MNAQAEEATPRHAHDCENCLFLGVHEEYDLYFCEQAAGGNTLVARYGSSGPDYISGIAFANSHPGIAAAKRIASDLELV